MIRTFTYLSVLFVMALGLACGGERVEPTGGSEGQPPNIVLVLVDDLSWYGTPVAMDPAVEASRMSFRNMPNIERLA